MNDQKNKLELDINEEAKLMLAEYKEKHVASLPNSNDNTPKDRNIVANSRDTVLDEIENSDDFKSFAKQLWSEETYTEGERQALIVARRKLQNELDNYALEEEKKLLKARARYEKGLAKEEAKAKAMQKKIKIAMDRYGYLYPLLDKDGNPKLDSNNNVIIDMTKFTPSKTSNRFREWAFNYSKLGSTTRNVVKTTLGILLTILGVTALGALLYGAGALLLPILSKVFA